MSMFFGATPSVFEKATILRKNMTKEEKVVWAFLQNKINTNYKFRRQHPISNYVVDFYCHALKLVIEIDGPNHKYLKQEDELRENNLRNLNLQIIRFTNEQVHQNLNEIQTKITNSIAKLSGLNL